MALSKRIMEIKPSAAVELDRLLAKMKASGEEIISLSAGQPDFDTPENIINACTDALHSGKTKYVSINGILELRQAICDKLAHDNGIFYEPDDIVITTGAKQALFNALQVIINENDEVIIPTPCWVSHKEMVKLAQGSPVLVKTTADFHLDLNQIRKAITDKTKAIIINTPNNPTGAVYSERELRDLAEIALEHQIRIISDEVYEKLTYGQNSHFSIASISEEVKNLCITVNGFSKSYSMTGWRIGYAAANRETAMAMCSLQGHSTSNSTTFVQWAAIEALKGPQDSVAKMKSEFEKRRELIYSQLTAIPGVKCTKPEGAFYMFPDFSYYIGKTAQSGKTVNSTADLCAYILRRVKVAILPGSAFDGEPCIRIAYANSVQNINKAMDLIKTALSELN